MAVSRALFDETKARLRPDAGAVGRGGRGAQFDTGGAAYKGPGRESSRGGHRWYGSES